MERFIERYFDKDEINDNYVPTGFARPVSSITASRQAYSDSANRYELTCHESYYDDTFQVGHFNYEQDVKIDVISYADRNKLVFDEKYYVDDYDSDLDLKKIQLLEENLEKIIRKFKKCRKHCKQFLKVYPVWNIKRKSVICELKGIAQTLDNTKFGCNVAKLVGSSVGAAGGILAITGAVLIPFTMGVSTPLIIGGVATSVTGGTTSLGTSIAEVVILKNKVQAAKDLLEKDKKEFHHIQEWFEHTTGYMESINEIMDINVFYKIIDDLKKLYNIFNQPVKTKSSGNIPVDKVAVSAKYLLEKVIGSSVASSVASTIFIAILTIPKLAKMFQEIIQLHHSNPVLFEALSLTSRICIHVARGMDIGADIFTTALKAADAGPMIVSASVGKALSQGLFAGLGFALDVTSLVLTSIDVHGGSKCPSAEKIKEANEKLENELDIVERIYLELLNCGMQTKKCS